VLVPAAAEPNAAVSVASRPNHWNVQTTTSNELSSAQRQPTYGNSHGDDDVYFYGAVSTFPSRPPEAPPSHLAVASSSTPPSSGAMPMQAQPLYNTNVPHSNRIQQQPEPSSGHGHHTSHHFQTAQAPPPLAAAAAAGAGVGAGAGAGAPLYDVLQLPDGRVLHVCKFYSQVAAADSSNSSNRQQQAAAIAVIATIADRSKQVAIAPAPARAAAAGRRAGYHSRHQQQWCSTGTQQHTQCYITRILCMAVVVWGVSVFVRGIADLGVSANLLI
jgi:hypothetical protein